MIYKAKVIFRYPNYLDVQTNGIFIAKADSKITAQKIKKKILDFMIPKISKVFKGSEGDQFDPSKLKATATIQRLPEEFIVKED
jgi:hypothetical protein